MANFQKLKIEKFVISGQQCYRVTGQEEILENMCHLLQISGEELTKKILYGQNVTEKEYCNDGETAQKRLEVLKIILYEMFVVELCWKINLKLKGEGNLAE